jgi:hypothetical protein
MAKSLNYADMAHYYKTGSFCRALIEEAVASKDEKLIAFAAGWLTHVAGDFGSHRNFVYPEAGFYLENEAGRDRHGELEKFAESIIFIERGRLLDEAYYTDERLKADILFNDFFKTKVTPGAKMQREDQVLRPFLNKVFQSVYKEPYHLELSFVMKNYDLAFGRSGGKMFGFEILNYKDAQKGLSLSPSLRLNLDSAFNYAANYGKKLLEDCLVNKSLFSDAWNLDVGPDSKTMVIKVQLDSQPASGSTNPLFINLKLGTTISSKLNYHMKVIKDIRYNRNDVLYSYVSLNPCSFAPDKKYSFFIGKVGPIKDDTRIKSISIEQNGIPVYFSDKKLELVKNAKNSSDEFYFSDFLNH